MSATDDFTGTRAVADQHAFDVPALQAWLLERPGTALATLTPTGKHP